MRGPLPTVALQEAFDWDVCHVVNSLQFDVRASDTKRLGVGGLLTEFGAETQDADGLKVLDLAMAKQDEALQGGALPHCGGNAHCTPHRHTSLSCVDVACRVDVLEPGAQH